MESDVRRALERVDGAGAGRKVGEQFSKSVGASAATGLRGSLNEMVSGITSQFGKAGKSVDSVFESIPAKAALGSAAVLGIGAAAITVGKQLYDLGAQWDDVVDTAAGRTGLLGDQLKGLTDSIKETANVTASSIPEIGDIASRVTQSLHLTGQPLQEMTKNIADLNALTGEQLNVRELGKAFRAFGVDVGDQVPQLNALWNASTATGIPINELVKAVGDGGSALREFGLDLGQSAALVTTFEEAGLDGATAVGSLRIALKNFADAGKEPQQALRDTITEIKNLSDAGNTAAATDLAAKTFGRGFAPFLDAIKSGKVDVDSLNQSLRQIGPNAAPSIEQARDATSDWQEQLTTLKNQLSTELEPAASATFSTISGLITVYLINPLKQANDLVHSLANFNPQGPSGPATLGPDGKPVAAPAPKPANDPLKIFAPRATGGPVFGAGTATSDSIPAMLSNGEHVFTADDVAAMGGQGGVYAFRKMLHRSGGGSILPMAQIPWPPGKINKTGDRAGNLPNLDSGFNPSQRALPWLLDPDSPIPSGPPGVPLPPTDDDILFPDSQPWWMRKWLEDHPPSSWKNPHRNMLLGAGLGFAGGGAVLPDGPGNYVVTPDNIMSAVEFAQSVNGKPYSYGGTGPLYDCSGFMSSIYGQVTGKPLPAGQRYFSTESDFSKLGFVKGFDADSPFNIGVHNGGGGKSSHMAGTLAGFNVESGSGGTLFGGAAAGANDSQFENKYHLPGSLTALASETGADVTKEYANSLGEGGQSAVKDLKDQGSQRSGPDGSSLGQSLVSGLLQGIGLDGSVFSNPLDWPNVKSGLALANWGGGLLKSAMGQEDSGAPDLTGGAGGGALSSIGLPSISGLLKPNAPAAAPAANPYANVVVNGNVGMDPRAFTQRVDAAQNQSWRRNMTAVRP